MATPRAGEQELITHILSLSDDPLAFVMFAFPWGKPQTPLEGFDGPRDWQRDILIQMRDHIAMNRQKQRDKLAPELMQIAIASGRGIGKSAFLAWVSLWLFCTVPSSTIIVSANSEQQLKTTTFPEIKKWATMSLMSTWFDMDAMRIRAAKWLSDSLRRYTNYDDSYWYIQARLWSEENPNAFAGLHSQRGMAVLFDEASGIPASIWPVTQGYFTDKTLHRFWVAISNPRNPSGAFFECFNKNRDFWLTRTVDARTVNENDQGLYNSIIRQYGADSDEARVEVYGQFPRHGDNQFISRGEVEDAVAREVIFDPMAPLVVGVDPARFGDDDAVIAFRQGRDASSIPLQRFKRCTTTELAEKVARVIDKYSPDGVCIEGDGVGGGVIDALKYSGYTVTEVTSGGGASNRDAYANMRTELWGRMRDWMPTGSLPDDRDLADDIASPMYDYNLRGQLKLEGKDKMKKRGYASPNAADALAMTFAKSFARKDNRLVKRRKLFAKIDYDVI